MSVSVGKELSPLAVSLRRGFQKFLPYSSESAMIVLNSSPLTNLTLATLKNLPYTMAAKQFGVNDLCHFISSRVNYLEVVFLSVASLVHNLMMGIFYTGLVALTMGISNEINFNCRKHCVHLVHASAALGIGLSGVMYPYAGMGLNLLMIMGVVTSLRSGYNRDLNHFEEPLLKEVKRIFDQHNALLHTVAKNHTSPSKYESELKPTIEYVGHQIIAAKTIDDLVSLGYECFRHFPLVDPNVRKEREEARQSAVTVRTNPRSHWANTDS